MSLQSFKHYRFSAWKVIGQPPRDVNEGLAGSVLAAVREDLAATGRLGYVTSLWVALS